MCGKVFHNSAQRWPGGLAFQALPPARPGAVAGFAPSGEPGNAGDSEAG